MIDLLDSSVAIDYLRGIDSARTVVEASDGAAAQHSMLLGSQPPRTSRN